MTEAEAGAAGLFHALAQPAEAWTIRPPMPMDAEGMIHRKPRPTLGDCRSAWPFILFDRVCGPATEFSLQLGCAATDRGL